MRIVLDIPEFPEDELRVWRVFSGIEERARIIPKKGITKIKTKQCNLCGKCCMQVTEDWKYGRKEDGSCAHLIYSEGWKGYLCDFGASRPFSCSSGDEHMEEHCSVEWK